MLIITAIISAPRAKETLRSGLKARDCDLAIGGFLGLLLGLVPPTYLVIVISCDILRLAHLL